MIYVTLEHFSTFSKSKLELYGYNCVEYLRKKLNNELLVAVGLDGKGWGVVGSPSPLPHPQGSMRSVTLEEMGLWMAACHFTKQLGVCFLVK